MMLQVLHFDSYLNLTMEIFHRLYSAWDVKVFVFIHVRLTVLLELYE
jgi:hypothetical protein